MMSDPDGLVGDTKEVTGDTGSEEVNTGTGCGCDIRHSGGVCQHNGCA